MPSVILLLALAAGLSAVPGVPPREDDLTGPWVLAYDESPRVLKVTKPGYPKQALRERFEGVIDVEFVIDVDGKVRDARVVVLDGHPQPLRPALVELHKEAIRTVREWRFQPARKDGKPVRTTGRVPVSFRIVPTDGH